MIFVDLLWHSKRGCEFLVFANLSLCNIQMYLIYVSVVEPILKSERRWWENRFLWEIMKREILKKKIMSENFNRFYLN